MTHGRIPGLAPVRPQRIPEPRSGIRCRVRPDGAFARSRRGGARAVALALGVLAALAFVVPPADAQFRVIETDHLRLLYPDPFLADLAPYAARCFENSLRFHERLWNWHPSEKVNVLLDDFTDYGNAGVWVNPRNSLVLHVAPTNFVYETGPSNERISFTMNHELVHVLALDRAAGADVAWRALFHGKVRETSDHPETIVYGHLALPRRAAPRWYHEGIAVFLETWMAGGLGRAQGPYDEMVFRSMVREGTPFYDPLGLEAEGTKVDFQVGVNSYLYGTRFMSDLAMRTAPESLLAWVGRSPGSRAPFTAQFRRVFGRSLDEGWRDWVGDEQTFQRANLDSIRRWPTTAARDLSPLALGSVSNAFVDSASHALIAAVYHPGALAHLAAIPLDGGPERVLREIPGPALYFVSSLAFDPGERRVFYTTDHNEWRDLRVFDLRTRRSTRLLRDARIGDLAFDRAHRTLWGVRHLNGYSSVVRLEPPYRDWHAVWTLPFGLDAYDLDVSPDGRWLAASFSEISGRQTLRLLPLESLARGDTASRVLHDFGNAIPEGFVFAPDGGSLWGSSYYTGVSNIYRYDLANDSLDLVSNAETGFFRPVPTGEDSLIVFRYGGRGFTPARILARPLADASAITYFGERLVERHPVLREWIAPPPSSVVLDSAALRPHPYRALAAVRWTTVVPIVEGYRGTTAVGADAEFSDPFGFHAFSLTGSWSAAPGVAADERAHVVLQYKRYDLTARWLWNPASFYDLAGTYRTSRKGLGQKLDWHRALWRDAPRTVELAVTASHWSGLDVLPDHQNVATEPGFRQLVAGGVELRDRNLRSSIGAADYEAGHVAHFGISGNGVRFETAGRSAWRGFAFVDGGYDVGHPIPGFRNSSLWLRTAVGWSPGDREEPFSNFFFGGFGNNGVDWQEPKRFRDAERLPGEPIDGVAGRNFGRGQVEWNLPAWRFRRAGTLGLYASWARLSLFGTGLATNLDDTGSRRKVADAGAQVDVRLQLFTQSPLTLSVGGARAFERGQPSRREWMVSLKVL